MFEIPSIDNPSDLLLAEFNKFFEEITVVLPMRWR
jgi:hypothetical protein